MQKKATGENESGFTLIELIIIIAIIGVTAAVAIPGYISMLPDWRLKGAARDLYSNMQKARVEAVKRNERWAIKFDSGRNTYTLCSSWVSSSDYFAEETVSLADYSNGIKFQSITYGSDTVVFNPRATGNMGYAYLDNEKNTEFRVGSQSSGVITLKRKIGGVYK